MPTTTLIDYDDASPRVKAVYDDIRATRKTDFINNFWKALANQPDNLERVWGELRDVMGPRTLDPMAKEMIYIAVSIANNCSYCVHSHTASARAKGMTEEQYQELMAVVAMAHKTNSLANGLQVPVDPEFMPEG